MRVRFELHCVVRVVLGGLGATIARQRVGLREPDAILHEVVVDRHVLLHVRLADWLDDDLGLQHLVEHVVDHKRRDLFVEGLGNADAAALLQGVHLIELAKPADGVGARNRPEVAAAVKSHDRAVAPVDERPERILLAAVHLDCVDIRRRIRHDAREAVDILERLLKVVPLLAAVGRAGLAVDERQHAAVGEDEPVGEAEPLHARADCGGDADAVAGGDHPLAALHLDAVPAADLRDIAELAGAVLELPERHACECRLDLAVRERLPAQVVHREAIALRGHHLLLQKRKPAALVALEGVRHAHGGPEALEHFHLARGVGVVLESLLRADAPAAAADGGSHLDGRDAHFVVALLIFADEARHRREISAVELVDRADDVFRIRTHERVELRHLFKRRLSDRHHGGALVEPVADACQNAHISRSSCNLKRRGGLNDRAYRRTPRPPARPARRCRLDPPRRRSWTALRGDRAQAPRSGRRGRSE